MIALNENCNCAKEVSASFEIRELEKLPQFDPIGTDTDTIYMNKNIRFIALEENAEYTWYIGSEIVTDKVVGRYFSSAQAGQTINVSLAVRKKPNTICLPNDDGYDSISRSFYVQTCKSCTDTVNFVNGKTLMEGTYRMKSNLLVDSFDVVINYMDTVSGLNNRIIIFNVDGKGTKVKEGNRCYSTNYRQFWLDEDSQSKFVTGSFHYKLNGTAEFIFTSSEIVNGINVQDYYKNHLIGRKLN